MRRGLFCALLCILFLLFPIPFSADAATVDGVVYDRIDLFTDAEIEQINQQSITHFGQISDCRIYIVTASSTGYTDKKFMAEYDVSENAIILIIYDNDARNYNMYTYGSADRRISDAEIDPLLDDVAVYDNIKSGKYAEGAAAFIRLGAECYLESDLDEPDTPDYPMIILIGLVGGVAVAVLVGVLIVLSYTRKSRSAMYPLDKYARLELTHRSENFMGSFVTKRVIQSSSSGGSRKSGGFRGGR
ncbi:MAG: TPM domain-containing protein [Clostridia bacterium]|nr:TPM domain-containing protein [Clostridia bacterium]